MAVRTSAKRAADEHKIVLLSTQGMSDAAIAKELGLGASTVSNALREVREAWRERSLDAYEEWVRDELERLDRIEEAAWKLLESQGKDTALQRILSCVRTRAKLLGLNAPDKVANTDPSGKREATAVQVYLPDNERSSSDVKNMLDEEGD